MKVALIADRGEQQLVFHLDGEHTAAERARQLDAILAVPPACFQQTIDRAFMVFGYALPEAQRENMLRVWSQTIERMPGHTLDLQQFAACSVVVCKHLFPADAGKLEAWLRVGVVLNADLKKEHSLHSAVQ
jgi:hypothetical protein